MHTCHTRGRLKLQFTRGCYATVWVQTTGESGSSWNVLHNCHCTASIYWTDSLTSNLFLCRHINPAVTFANCVYRKFPWRKFPIYMLSQTLGAMCASAIVYGNYKSAIDAYEGGPNIRTVPGYSDHASAGIFCTYPAPFMTRTGMFFSEFISSTILMFMIYALKDEGNIGAGPLTPLGLFFVIFGELTASWIFCCTNFYYSKSWNFWPEAPVF